jgi:hypothetical protein
MPKPKPEPKKIGRPILPKGDAKAKIVPVRFKPEEIAKITRQRKFKSKPSQNGFVAR